MAKYIMQEMPDLQGDKQVIRYPRMLIKYRYSTRQIAQEIASGTTFSQGEIEGLVLALTHNIADKLAQGYSVKIDGLGVFSAKLGLRDGFEPERTEGTKRNAASLHVSGVRFRSDKELINRINQSCRLERVQSPQYNNHNQGREQRLEELRTYLAEHGFVRVSAYAAMMGLSHSSASRELRIFLRDGHISSVGYASHKLYILPKDAKHNE